MFSQKYNKSRKKKKKIFISKMHILMALKLKKKYDGIIGLSGKRN